MLHDSIFRALMSCIMVLTQLHQPMRVMPPMWAGPAPIPRPPLTHHQPPPIPSAAAVGPPAHPPPLAPPPLMLPATVPFVAGPFGRPVHPNVNPATPLMAQEMELFDKTLFSRALQDPSRENVSVCFVALNSSTVAHSCSMRRMSPAGSSTEWSTRTM